MQIVVCPLSQIEKIGREYQPEAMITILSAPCSAPRPKSVAADRHLQLFFDDISFIAPEFRAAGRGQIEKLTAFGRQWAEGAWPETDSAETEAAGHKAANADKTETGTGKAVRAAREARQKPAPLLIHCQMGISRSPAAAYILACALNARKTEAEWAAELRARAPQATPNPHMIALADEILSRQGRMKAAIAAIGGGAWAFEGAPFALEV